MSSVYIFGWYNQRQKKKEAQIKEYLERPSSYGYSIFCIHTYMTHLLVNLNLQDLLNCVTH